MSKNSIQSGGRYTLRRFSFAASPFLVAILTLGSLCISNAKAVLVSTTTANITAPPDDPGWNHIGARGVYLGDGWVLTANHVGEGSLDIPAGTFEHVPNQSYIVPNPTTWGGEPLSAETDLRLYRINGDPGLSPLTIATQSVPISGEVTMIGAGRDRPGTQSHWQVDTNADPWSWQTVSSGGNFHGYTMLASRTKRWGTNRISNDDPIFGENDADLNGVVSIGSRDVVSLVTVFDQFGGTSNEALAAPGDSGGGVFFKRNGQWELAGIMNAALIFDNQRSDWAVFGDATAFADLSVYHDAIVGIMDANPEYSIMGDINLDGIVSGDGSGSIETDDLSAFIAGWNNDAAVATVETWKLGDLDLDGDTDLHDFALLRGAYPSAAGLTSLLAGAAVPEPSTFLLMLILGLGSFWATRRRRM